MANNLSFWEVDPFFPAAEEVQNSTDRMESIFRTWRYTETLAQATPEDAAVVAAVDANRRDLMVALNTVRWQLEEFARAVKVATTTEQVYLGEDAKSRHSQFVRAIQSQVSNVEKALGDEPIKKYKYEEEDSKCLALFLSGSDVDNSPRAALQEDARDSSCNSIETPTVSIRVDMDRCWNAVNGETVNGFAHQNGSMVAASQDGKPNGLLSDGGRELDGTSCENVNRTSNLWNGFGIWGLCKGKHRAGKIQMSKSGLKRWKDGDASFFDRAEECISGLKNGCMDDLEQARSGNWATAGCRKANGAYSPPKVEVLGDRSINGSSSSGTTTIQRRLQRAHQSIPFGNAVQITVGAVVVLGLMGLYFWFLSTLVPYDNQAVPGSFLN